MSFFVPIFTVLTEMEAHNPALLSLKIVLEGCRELLVLIMDRFVHLCRQQTI